MLYSTLSNTAHSTDAEIDFISNLGTNKYRMSEHSQKWHLKNYLINFKKRKRWMNVDRDRCYEHANELLRQLGG